MSGYILAAMGFALFSGLASDPDEAGSDKLFQLAVSSALWPLSLCIIVANVTRYIAVDLRKGRAA